MEAEDETLAASNPGERASMQYLSGPFMKGSLPKLLTPMFKEVQLDFQTRTDVWVHFGVLKLISMALIFNSLPFKSYKPKVLSSGAASRGRAQGAGAHGMLQVGAGGGGCYCP